MTLTGMTLWLQLASKDDFQLHYNNHMISIVQKLLNLSYQKSSLHFFLGWECKNATVQNIFITNKQNSYS